MDVPGGIGSLEYLLTAFFSAIAAILGYLSRRGVKQNSQQLNQIEHQTNGQLEEKIAAAVQKAVTHDELVSAVRDEAIRDFLDGLLVAHLDDEEDAPKSFDPQVLAALDMLHSSNRITDRRQDHASSLRTTDSPDAPDGP